ncbi:MAG: hypothetical protein U0Q18_07815 [Bryobacteraceae bacterium]
MSVTIWANSKDVPGVVCRDARLSNRDKIRWPLADRPISSTDQVYGQAGWDVGLNYMSIDDLAGQLETLVLPKYVPGGGHRIERGGIRRLAIHAHGTSGTIFINGQDAPVKLTAETVQSLQKGLVRIGLMTPDDAKNPAVILFPGCLAGSGKGGTKLLIALSKVWPDRKVVGFVSLGYAPGGSMARSGEACNEPGMRDTTAIFQGEADRDAGRFWPDLTKWPWASETSPRAKVAYNGDIVVGKQWD